MQSNQQLELAYDFVKYTGQNIFLTGKAGTGKTTFLKSLKDRSPKRMIVVAPTGVAAINAGGVTIHSFFQLSFAPQLGNETKMLAEQRFSKEKINIMRTLDLLVIDEVSMVRADILDAIDRTLRRFKNRQKPFGGAQVLMIGDLQQLAPVIKDAEWSLLKQEYDTPFFFSSKALKEFPYISIELTEVFRQQDEIFIALLNKVRENKLDEPTRESLNKRYIPGFEPDDEEGYITLCTHNFNAQGINNSKLAALPGKEHIFTAKVDGKFPEYSYPTEFDLKLKVGAQVMFVKNDSSPEKRFYNGKIGQIQSIEDGMVYILCPGEDEEIALEAQVWENFKYSLDSDSGEIKEEFEGSFTQIPLKLAWAITIHKSQGLTFEKAIIDAEASFAHGQVYVALSRCKTLEGMVLSSKIAAQSIVSDNTVSGFIKNVEENQPGSKELTVAKLAYQQEQLTELFRFYRLEYLVRSLATVISENKGAFADATIKAFDVMRTAQETEISVVADKFRKQILEFLKSEPDVSKNEALQDRIKKAAEYFGKKVQTVMINALESIDFDIDNKTIKRRLNRYVSDLLEEAGAKEAAFRECEDGFDIRRIMDARAKDMLAKNKTKPVKKKAKAVSDYSNVPHPEVFERLRSYRTEKTIALGLPAYMVFSQKVLYELSHYLPTDALTLKLINGLGARKIQQFGADILGIIRNYIGENNIQTEEIPLKEGPKKEKKPKVDTKKLSFELFESGKTVEEIAKERGFAIGTIESHLAHYVKLGKLDVTKLINQDKLKKISLYFEKADDKTLNTAKAHFGDEFSYGELRLAQSYVEGKG